MLWDMIKMKVRASAEAKNYKNKSHEDILYKELSGLEKNWMKTLP